MPNEDATEAGDAPQTEPRVREALRAREIGIAADRDAGCAAPDAPVLAMVASGARPDDSGDEVRRPMCAVRDCTCNGRPTRSPLGSASASVLLSLESKELAAELSRAARDARRGELECTGVRQSPLPVSDARLALDAICTLAHVAAIIGFLVAAM